MLGITSIVWTYVLHCEAKNTMDNNTILRRMRYVFDYSDNEMISLFSLGGKEVSRSVVSNWLKKEDDDQFDKINDKELATFLNGFITHKRGIKEGPKPVPEKTLTNNLILRKLKIALNLRDEDMLEILYAADLHISKHELSAFFRKPGQRQYRECKDQVLRNFIYGMQLMYKKRV